MACQSYFGPTTLNTTHPAYNQAIVNTLDQQMLLNLVRLKYRDQPYFLKVGSVTVSPILTSNLGINSEADWNPSGGFIAPNVGISFQDRPTITYNPLEGEDFLKSILSSISLEAILVIIFKAEHADTSILRELGSLLGFKRLLVLHRGQ